MPIVRYFVFIGALLLALLFAADRYLPAPVAQASPTDPDRTIIRIASARSLPEKIVFDTRPRTELPRIAQADPIFEEPQQQMRAAVAAMSGAPSEIKKEATARVSLESRPHPKRSAKLSKRVRERRLAFERSDSLSGGWW
ncbi:MULTISPECIES: hypothetical protein [unclassified Bradyrhizobium]|uniref:hypothetical protein n=1 Tax=unclassified Bradyrhizobium TaxID=2631580 RepID=UPI0024B11F4E|nr:hypothetical protein [Bradyrhizobium sp. CB2312]WFU76395.1 hypothetical protein QA642_21530 [Bradyrhizobium sp. CB2312]